VAHVFVPVFRERLSGFYAKAVEVEVVLIFVFGAELFGQFAGFIAYGDELHAHDVVFA